MLFNLYKLVNFSNELFFPQVLVNIKFAFRLLLAVTIEKFGEIGQEVVENPNLYQNISGFLRSNFCLKEDYSNLIPAKPTYRPRKPTNNDFIELFPE